ncbi:hypothetical protein FPQ18DRAFT_301898 [Pyronema domesticum]|nr:hypothetical protein FPQ18DRAFT_301898 [Pyronema domesticum]
MAQGTGRSGLSVAAAVLAPHLAEHAGTVNIVRYCPRKLHVGDAQISCIYGLLPKPPTPERNADAVAADRAAVHGGSGGGGGNIARFASFASLTGFALTLLPG